MPVRTCVNFVLYDPPENRFRAWGYLTDPDKRAQGLGTSSSAARRLALFLRQTPPATERMFARMFLLLTLALLGTTPAAPGAPAAASAPKKARLFIVGLTPSGGVEQATAAALTEALTHQISSQGVFEVLSAKEVDTILGSERQRQLTGCSEEAAACLTELGDALGARLVLSGSLARLGTAYQLTLQTLDTVKAAPIGRSTRISSDLAVLQAQLPYASAEALALPLPPPPSRFGPYSLLGGGGLVFLGGGLVVFHSVTRELDLQREFTRAADGTSRLRPLADYRQDLDGILQQRTTGLVIMAVGAAAGVAGVLLMPPDTQGRRGLVIAPVGPGIGLAGVFP